MEWAPWLLRYVEHIVKALLESLRWEVFRSG